jgi:mRNA-degrading endonuclease RelE of RelBE toxin-antitoxin system
MSFEIISISKFDRQAKRLSKKFPSLKNELSLLFDSLEANPFQGDSIGHDCYKIRIAIASKGKGKSSGGRVISHVLVKDEVVYLLSIYDKSEQTSISDRELLDMLATI